MLNGIRLLCVGIGAMLLYACASTPTPEVGTTIGGTVAGYYPSTNPVIAVNPGLTNAAYDYPVLYGTTRQPIKNADGKVTGYSLARDDELHYGRVWVTIPKNHKVGSVGTSGGQVFGYDPKLVVHAIDQADDLDQFIALAKSQLPPVSSPETSYVLVFVHGYNNDFSDVAIRAAQLGADLGVPPNDMFMFSWASMNRVPTYPIDEATVDASEIYLRRFLETVIRVANGRTVHVIAHSMGNRAMLRVATAMAADMKPGQPKPFGQVILASPDVDAELFGELGPSYVRVAHRTTVYLSPYDFAVASSSAIHDYPRVGCGSSPQANVRDIDNVVSTLPSDFPSHTYFAEILPLLADVKNLLLRDTPARNSPDWVWTGSYWRVGPPVEMLNPLLLACPPHPLFVMPSATAARL